MPPHDKPPLTRGVVLRACGLAVAIALGGVGVWLIATGTDMTPKRTQLGVLAGFWGLLIGAFAMFGSRRAGHGQEPPETVHVTAQPGSAVELRAVAPGLERAEDAAWRRDYEQRLERMLRHEIRASVAHEVAALRTEIAELRSELLEKVGGQLRLERIETTRVIGSDLEALHHEVRELKHATRETDGLGFGRPLVHETVRQIVEPARVRPVTRETAEVEADVRPARTWPEPALRPEPEPTLRPEPEPTLRPEPVRTSRREPEQVRQPPVPAVEQTIPIRLPAPAPEPPAEPVPEPPAGSAPEPPAGSVPQPSPAATPLPTAGIPTTPPPPPSSPPPPPSAPPPAPVATPAAAEARPAAGAAPGPAVRPEPAPEPEPEPAPRFDADPFAGLPRIRPFTDFELDPIEDEPAYTGRRRRGDEQPAGDAGRHAHAAEPPGGRRRAPEDGHDLLARLLARETR